MGKTRDLLKETGDTKGTVHAKIGTIKDKYGKLLIEAEEIKKGGKNTQNSTKKLLMTQITTVVWSFAYSKISWSVKSSGP